MNVVPAKQRGRSGFPPRLVDWPGMGEETAFRIGDAVRLRVDGSPEMVVEAIDETGRLVCAWTDGAGNRQRHAFPSRSLRAVEAAPDAGETAGP